MLAKTLAVVRTLFLVFLIGYTVRALPLWREVAKTFDEQYARCAENLAFSSRAAWFGIAWIAFETFLGWWGVTRAGQRKLAAPATPRGGAGEPPHGPR